MQPTGFGQAQLDQAGVTVFEKFIAERRLHGARVTVVENPDGTVAHVYDDPTDKLTLVRGPVNLEAETAIDLAEWLVPEAVDSSTELVWFRAGEQAVLAWEVRRARRRSHVRERRGHFPSKHGLLT
ncbi:MAG: hypothetical protein AAFY46_17130, partial [Planctomycetota bacterium]